MMQTEKHNLIPFAFKPARTLEIKDDHKLNDAIVNSMKLYTKTIIHFEWNFNRSYKCPCLWAVYNYKLSD